MRTGDSVIAGSPRLKRYGKGTRLMAKHEQHSTAQLLKGEPPGLGSSVLIGHHETMNTTVEGLEDV